MNDVRPVKIGTRGSKLATTQTNMVAEALRVAHPGLIVEVVEVKTMGDRKQGTALASKGDKRDWIYELELGVQSGEIDLAVHSGKDVPAELAKNTRLFPVLSRANPHDVFIGKKKSDGTRLTFAEVPQNASIGTASLRRRAEILRARPDITVVEHRGNVPTRVQKLDDSETLSGIVLAAAGLERLVLPDLHPEILSEEMLLPAINQGILTVQFLDTNTQVAGLLKDIQDFNTIAAFEAERGVVSVLQGDCDTAISIFADLFKSKLRIRVKVLLPDGTRSLNGQLIGDASKAQELGQTLAKDLIARGAEEILKESKNFRAQIRSL